MFNSAYTGDGLLSTVTVNCPVNLDNPSKVCDSFELGIIGQLDYQMYDIAIMVTNTPEELLVHDLATLSFRLSHDNDAFLSWLASVRLICLLISAAIALLYFVTSCSCSGLNTTACLTLNPEQYWVLSLLFLCALFDEPLFELRRNNPGLHKSVIAEIPESIFFTTLLTYWLTSVALVRVRGKKLISQKKKATLEDITGVLSVRRLLGLLILLVGFVVAQSLLHYRYLTTETNRVIFSSFQHFKTSESLDQDGSTIVLIIINAIFALIYLGIFIFEAVRSFLDFQRLPFAKKVGHLITAIMMILTLLVLLGKFSRAGGFSAQLTITVIYNIYMWHLGYLYVPVYTKLSKEERKRQELAIKNSNAKNRESGMNQSEMHVLGNHNSINRSSVLQVPNTNMDL